MPGLAGLSGFMVPDPLAKDALKFAVVQPPTRPCWPRIWRIVQRSTQRQQLFSWSFLATAGALTVTRRKRGSNKVMMKGKRVLRIGARTSQQ